MTAPLTIMVIPRTILVRVPTVWDISTWTDEERANSRRFVEAQFDAYDQGSGWIFWTYKTENSIEWDFRRLVENGIIPYPLDSKTTPTSAGSKETQD